MLLALALLISIAHNRLDAHFPDIQCHFYHVSFHVFLLGFEFFSFAEYHAEIIGFSMTSSYTGNYSFFEFIFLPQQSSLVAELWRSVLGATDSYHWPQCGPQVHHMIFVTPSIPSHLRMLSPTQFLFPSAYVIPFPLYLFHSNKMTTAKVIVVSLDKMMPNNQFLARASYTEDTWPLQKKPEFSIRLHLLHLLHMRRWCSQMKIVNRLVMHLSLRKEHGLHQIKSDVFTKLHCFNNPWSWAGLRYKILDWDNFLYLIKGT